MYSGQGFSGYVNTYIYEGEWFLFLIDKGSISGCHADVGPRGKKQVSS